MLDTLRSTLTTLLPRAKPERFVERRTPGIPRPWPDPGLGADWQSPVYGEYYARSADVYAAVKLRAEAVARPPLVVAYVRPSTRSGRTAGQEGLVPAGPGHPVQRLLDTVNPWWSTADLLAATETYLCLWGAAFWRLDREGEHAPGIAIWPLRPDRVRVVRDAARYVAGFVYSPPDQPGREVPLLPEEVVWFRYFNPLDEHAGFSPVAAARLTADMGIEAVRFNRDSFRTGMHPLDLVFHSKNSLNGDQLEQFQRKIEDRLAGREKAHRPLVTSDDWDVQRLGLGPRDMEWLAGLRWSLETVARVYGVPLPLLEDFSHATLNNVREARRLFWEKTVVPELVLLQSVMNGALLPRLGSAGQDVTVAFDLSVIEALSESESERTKRQVELVKAGILTVDEARRERGLPAGER